MINQVQQPYCKQPCGNLGNDQETVYYQLPEDSLSKTAHTAGNLI